MNNKYFYVIDNNSHKSLSLKKQLLSILSKANWILDKELSEFIFVIGGDGTFLKNVCEYKNKKIIAINGGNLGYFSYFNKANLKSILNLISKENNFKQLLTLNLEINGNNYCSLNEIYITSNHTFNANIYICNQKLELFKGSGIMISTPMGSTAHNKNAGGAIIYQNENLIQLLEIHPITQKRYSTLKSPLILNKNAPILITNNIGCYGNVLIDGKIIDDNFINKAYITTKMSDFYVYVPSTPKMFIKKLRNSFIREK